MTVKRARLIDVARTAGVSTATVSFVLSGAKEGRTPASPETVRRIHEAAEALGYVPNGHAQAMRRGYSSAIVLALGNPGDPWNAQVAREVQERAHPRGFSTLTLVDETWYEFLSGFTPGVAFVTSTDFETMGRSKVETLAERGGLLVVFSTQIEAEHFDVICSSPVGPTQSAYEQLRRRHDSVHLLVTAPPTALGHGPSRETGFRLGATAVGDDDVDQHIHRVPWGEDLVRACRNLLGRQPRPEAVVCSTGFLARVLRSVVLSEGLRCPEDLEIIAIGDIPDNQASHLGPISLYGTPRVFERIADIVVDRAVAQTSRPFRRHDFTWEFLAGATTRST